MADPSVSAVPTEEDQEPERDILSRTKSWFKECRPTREQWLEEARECYAFRAGDQWTDEDKEKLRGRNQPAITFNRIGPVVNSVTGSEVSNRQEVRYIPRGLEDQGVNELLTQAAEWVRDECDAADEESDAFEDLIISGMGWTETRLDYETNTDGKICIERVDPLEMWWDHKSKRRNIDDARYVARVKDIDIDEARAMFPGKEDFELDAKWAKEYDADAETEPHDATKAPWYSENQPDNRKIGERVRIVEVQWWDRETVWKIADAGQVKALSAGEWKTLKKRAKEMGIEVNGTAQPKRVYYRAFLGNVVLEEGPGPCDKSFTYKCFTGYRDRNKNLWYGLVKAALDPQRWANKWLSQTLHILNSNSKGGLLAERDAFDNTQKAEEAWASPEKIVWLKNGALAAGKVKERQISQMPTGFEKAMEWGIVAIRDSTGVSVEFQGLADRQQAGVLEYQRKQAALTVLATLFDALRRYRKEQGRLLLYMIQHYISDGRLIRLAAQDGSAKYVPLVRLPDTVEYDVIVDDAPDAPNMKERVWSILQSMMPVLQGQQAPPAIWAEILKFSPLPETLSNKIGQILTQAPAQIPPEIQQTLEKLTEENKQLKDKREETQANLMMKREEMQADMALAQQKLVAEIRQSQEESNAKLAMQWQELMAEMRMKRVEIAGEHRMAEMGARHAEEKHQSDMALSAAKVEAMKKQRKDNGQRADR